MSESDQPIRRETYVEHDVVYAAAGASAAPDLVRFPPQDSTPFESEQRLGSGAERFLTASSTLMTWGAHRAVGIEVTEERQGDEDRYAGVAFDGEGNPEPAPAAEVRYGPDGEPFLIAGTTARLRWSGNGRERRLRVVYVVDESGRVGFALGTADEAGAIGEIAYLVEHREDDSVWAIARGFHWAPANGLFGMKSKSAIKAAEKDAAAILAALAPGAVRRSDERSDAAATDSQDD